VGLELHAQVVGDLGAALDLEAGALGRAGLPGEGHLVGAGGNGLEVGGRGGNPGRERLGLEFRLGFRFGLGLGLRLRLGLRFWFRLGLLDAPKGINLTQTINDDKRFKTSDLIIYIVVLWATISMKSAILSKNLP
jgi:hypothetical protein